MTLSIGSARASSWGLTFAALAACTSPPPEPPKQRPESRPLAEHALERARAHSDALVRTRLLAGLAVAWARAHRSEEALRLLSEAHASSASIPSALERGYAEVEVVEAALAAGAVDRAESFSQAIRAPERRAEAELRRVLALVERQEFEGAERLAERITQPRSRHQALASLMTYFAERVQPEQAERLLEKLGNGPERERALAQLALAWVRRGRMIEYDQLSAFVVNPHVRGEMLASLALWHARSGHKAAALKVLRTIESAWLRARAEVELALFARASGRTQEFGQGLEAAVRTARGIHDPLLRGAALLDLARRLADAGGQEDAESILALIEIAEVRQEGIAHLVELAARDGALELAEERMHRLEPDSLWAGRGALALAKVYAVANNTDLALSTAAKVSAAEERLPLVAELAVSASAAGRPARNGEVSALARAIDRP